MKGNALNSEGTYGITSFTLHTSERQRALVNHYYCFSGNGFTTVRGRKHCVTLCTIMIETNSDLLVKWKALRA